jgi:lipopolysaccharide transport system permease protein
VASEKGIHLEMKDCALSDLPVVDIGPLRGWFNLRLKELWGFRELLYFLIWRDIKVRYKQTILGAAWVVIQPLVTMVIFSIVFGRLANLPSDGIPYPIFSYTALLPWQLFSRALSDGSSSLVNNRQFVTKIYFPRLFLPTASVLSGLVDFFIALVILFGMMWYFNIPFTPRILLLPILVLFTILTSLAVALWLSSFNVRYRDVKYTLPFLVQAWLYATPVVYSSTLVPENWRIVYGINPMAGVVEGFRWALLGKEAEIAPMISVSVLIVLLLFFGGLIYFQRMESSFSDVI